MRIERLKPGDCLEVAQLHKEAFSSFFLTSLGRSFLRAFYQAIVNHPNGIAIGLYEDQKLIAFAVGTDKAKGFYSSILKRNAISLILKSLPALIKNPQYIYRLLISLKTQKTESTHYLNLSENASLLSICIDPDLKKRGLGTVILSAFEELALLKANGIILTTDAENNDVVNHFYKKNNWVLLNEIYQGKRKMNLYYKIKNA